MTNERFGQYQFELSGVQLPDSGKWVPYLEIRIHSQAHADGEIIFPRQRIAEEELFDSEDAAISEARRFATAHVTTGEF